MEKKLTFLFQKQDLGYCRQPFPFFSPLYSLFSWWGGGKGAQFGYEMEPRPLQYIYIYGGLSRKLGATSKRRAMGVKERLTRRRGTKRDVSERYELRGFFIEL